jgi:hypothetical protein
VDLTIDLKEVKTSETFLAVMALAIRSTSRKPPKSFIVIAKEDFTLSHCVHSHG